MREHLLRFFDKIRIDAEAVFAGPGELRARCRALDWAATPLARASARNPLQVRETRSVAYDAAGHAMCASL